MHLETPQNDKTFLTLMIDYQAEFWYVFYYFFPEFHEG